MSKTQCFQVSVACTHVCSMNVHMSESKASHRVPSTTAPATSYMVSRLSHASVRAVHYNPFLDCVFSWMSLRLFTAPRPQATLALRKLKRDSSVFVTVDTSKVPEGPGLGVLSLCFRFFRHPSEAISSPEFSQLCSSNLSTEWRRKTMALQGALLNPRLNTDSDSRYAHRVLVAKS